MISRPNQHLSSRDTQSFAKLSVWLATLNLLITSIYAKCPRISLWVFVNSEPLYGYLTTSISPRVFIEYLHRAKCSTPFGTFLCRHCKSSVVKLDWNGNAIVASISTTPLRQWRSSRLRCRRKSIQKLNIFIEQSAAHLLARFFAVIARVALSNLTEMAMRSLLQSLLRRFVNGDRRDFDVVGNPYRSSISSSSKVQHTFWHVSLPSLQE